VRSLEREIGKVCRTKAVQYSTAGDTKSYDPSVSADDIEAILGMAKYDQEVREKTLRPGVVTSVPSCPYLSKLTSSGMAYSGSGMGGILLLETMLVPGGKGKLVLTGSLGDVIKESAELGLTWVKSRAVALGITSHRSQDPLKNVDIHVSLTSTLTTYC
jgi:ATP-dependent Lon protease